MDLLNGMDLSSMSEEDIQREIARVQSELEAVAEDTTMEETEAEATTGEDDTDIPMSAATTEPPFPPPSPHHLLATIPPVQIPESESTHAPVSAPVPASVPAPPVYNPAAVPYYPPTTYPPISSPTTPSSRPKRTIKAPLALHEEMENEQAAAVHKKRKPSAHDHELDPDEMDEEALAREIAAIENQLETGTYESDPAYMSEAAIMAEIKSLEKQLGTDKKKNSSKKKSSSDTKKPTTNHKRKHDAITTSTSNNSGEKRFCICRKPYSADQPMITCELCDEWYHYGCVGLTRVEAQCIEKYVCKKHQGTSKAKITYKDADAILAEVANLSSTMSEEAMEKEVSEIEAFLTKLKERESTTPEEDLEPLESTPISDNRRDESLVKEIRHVMKRWSMEHRDIADQSKLQGGQASLNAWLNNRHVSKLQEKQHTLRLWLISLYLQKGLKVPEHLTNPDLRTYSGEIVPTKKTNVVKKEKVEDVKEPHSKYSVGDKVDARWMPEGTWHAGKVIGVENGQIHIHYLYDEREDEWINVRAKRLAPLHKHSIDKSAPKSSSPPTSTPSSTTSKSRTIKPEEKPKPKSKKKDDEEEKTEESKKKKAKTSTKKETTEKEKKDKVVEKKEKTEKKPVEKKEKVEKKPVEKKTTEKKTVEKKEKAEKPKASAKGKNAKGKKGSKPEKKEETPTTTDTATIDDDEAPLSEAITVAVSPPETTAPSEPEPGLKSPGKQRITKHPSIRPKGITFNEDFCAKCGSGGMLLCCDGCPKVYHGNCVVPRVDITKLRDELWFCHDCVVAKRDTTIRKQRGK